MPKEISFSADPAHGPIIRQHATTMFFPHFVGDAGA
jgi:hypothetical protein